MLLRDRILMRAITLKMLHDVGIGLSYVMYDVGRTAAHAIHATRLSSTQAHLCVRLPAVPSPCHVPGEAVPWRNVKWKMYSQSNLPCPLGAQTRVLIASLCALNLRILQSLRKKRIMYAQRGFPHARRTQKQGQNRKVCPCPRPRKAVLQQYNATEATATEVHGNYTTPNNWPWQCTEHHGH